MNGWECSQFQPREEDFSAGNGPSSHAGQGPQGEPGQGEWPVPGLGPREGAGPASSCVHSHHPPPSFWLPIFQTSHPTMRPRPQATSQATSTRSGLSARRAAVIWLLPLSRQQLSTFLRSGPTYKHRPPRHSLTFRGVSYRWPAAAQECSTENFRDKQRLCFQPCALPRSQLKSRCIPPGRAIVLVQRIHPHRVYDPPADSLEGAPVIRRQHSSA